mgnify:CR=1 FL=1
MNGPNAVLPTLAATPILTSVLAFVLFVLFVINLGEDATLTCVDNP